MKKTKLSLTVAALILASVVIMSSCAKKTTTPTPTSDTSTNSSTDNNLAQQNAHDITNIGSQGIENDNGSLSTYRTTQGGGMFGPMSTSVTVVINTSAKNMTVTFNNYYGYDGHWRNGTVYYDWSASTNNAVWYRDSGMVLNVTTPNVGGVVYTVDGNTVHINTKTIKNIGRVNGQLTWTDNSDIVVTRTANNGGGTILWNGQWSVALLNTSAYTATNFDGTATSHTYPGVFNGYGGTLANCINWGQALIGVSGTFGGTAADGETYTGNIQSGSPLVLNLNCTPYWSKYLYVSGVLNFTPTGKATRTINYGNGVCDLSYVVSIGSYSITITL